MHERKVDEGRILSAAGVFHLMPVGIQIAPLAHAIVVNAVVYIEPCFEHSINLRNIT